MDDQNKNLILATVLSFLVILLWYTLFPPPETQPVPETPAQSQTAGETAPAATGGRRGRWIGSSPPPGLRATAPGGETA